MSQKLRDIKPQIEASNWDFLREMSVDTDDTSPRSVSTNLPANCRWPIRKRTPEGKGRLLDGVLAGVLLTCIVLPLVGIASSVLSLFESVPETFDARPADFAEANVDVANTSDSGTGNVRVNPHPKQRCSVCFGKGHLTTRDMNRISEPGYSRSVSEPIDPLQHWVNYYQDGNDVQRYDDDSISQRQCLVCEGHGYIDWSN